MFFRISNVGMCCTCRRKALTSCFPKFLRTSSRTSSWRRTPSILPRTSWWAKFSWWRSIVLLLASSNSWRRSLRRRKGRIWRSGAWCPCWWVHGYLFRKLSCQRLFRLSFRKTDRFLMIKSLQHLRLMFVFFLLFLMPKYFVVTDIQWYAIYIDLFSNLRTKKYAKKTKNEWIFWFSSCYSIFKTSSMVWCLTEQRACIMSVLSDQR